MDWICLEFAKVNLNDQLHFTNWLKDKRLFYGKTLSRWIYFFIEHELYEELKKVYHSEVTEDIHFELNGIHTDLLNDDVQRDQFIYEHRNFLIPIQEEINVFLFDIGEGQKMARELNEEFKSTFHVSNMIGMKYQDRLNEKFKKITFGIALEESATSMQWTVRPIIQDFETLLYDNLMRYINDLNDVIFCKRCNGLIDNPKTGQKRNYRRGVGAFCEPCGEQHRKEKNIKNKQRSRRKNNEKK
ncbi:hypothetical protein [Metabacillus halosaccharovorans]|uniref:hypothetical protein n=1 Tax=Metabacillus halosaccharovorans TaxID=930124 RepID=UPI002040444F|nr:hypothetical protein [Metabacillus halosaccharovorans]MCM3442668.1 hypothetical protein [Metabacillus halosaccharovorans]